MVCSCKMLMARSLRFSAPHGQLGTRLATFLGSSTLSARLVRVQWYANFPPCLEVDHSNYYSSWATSIDASPNNGHSHRHRDAVSILCAMEPLNRATWTLTFVLYDILASLYYYLYNMSDPSIYD